MDYGRPPGEELDPQAVPTGPAAVAYPPPVLPPVPPSAQRMMAPEYYFPGAVATEAGLLIPAGFGPRLGAFIIDALVLGVLLQVFNSLAGVPEPTTREAMEAIRSLMELNFDAVNALTPPVWVPILSSFICGAYYTLFHAYNGASLGKLALGLQVRRADGNRLSLGLAFARYVLYWLCAKFLYTAWLIWIDREKRTAYDMLLKLNVYKVLK